MGKTGKAAAARTIVNVSLDVGHWLDVMDSEGTWNVAQVIRFPTLQTVEVRYDGWGPEFNEVVPLNSERVAPYHMYTWSVKCWAKYKNWPWWPSIVTIRSPGTEAGKTYLENEYRLFVDFLDHKDITKRCRCWVELSKITHFDDRYDDHRKRTSGTTFENSLTLALKSTATTKFPPFLQGTLPSFYENEIATPVKKMKKELGMHEWAGYINTNRSRHRAVYVYKSTDSGDFPDDEEEDDGEDYVVQFTELSDDKDGKKKAPRGKGKGKALRKAKSPKSENSGKSPTVDIDAEVSNKKPDVILEQTTNSNTQPESFQESSLEIDPPRYPSAIEDQETLVEAEGIDAEGCGTTSVKSDNESHVSRKRKTPDSPDFPSINVKHKPEEP